MFFYFHKIYPDAFRLKQQLFNPPSFFSFGNGKTILWKVTGSCHFSCEAPCTLHRRHTLLDCTSQIMRFYATKVRRSHQHKEKTQMMVSKIKYIFKLRYIHCLFRHNVIACLTDYSIVEALTFIRTRKQNLMEYPLLWRSGTEPIMCLRVI